MTRLPPHTEFTGIGMTDKYMVSPNFTDVAPLHFACVSLIEAAGKLRCIEVWGVDSSWSPENIKSFARNDILTAAEKIADWLGCDLVPRLTPAEAHEAALERGHVEDGASDLGMGR